MLPRLPVTTTVIIKYCLPNHYNAHHIKYAVYKKKKPEPYTPIVITLESS